MSKAGGLARVAMLAIGLGIGAAVAALPGTASADSSTDWLSAVDSLLGSAALPAADTSGLNMAVSIDGVQLFQSGTAFAYSGTNGDIAMATGANDTAYAFGTGNYASVLGTNDIGIAGGTSDASALGSTGDNVYIDGDNDYAFAGGLNGVDDGAEITGSNDVAEAGSSATGVGSYDVAYVEGSNLGTADATGANYLVDVLKAYGDGSADAAATANSGSLLADLLPSVDASGAATGGNFLTDLLSAFDASSAAADSSHFFTELASLF
jgi:hypothetical protein